MFRQSDDSLTSVGTVCYPVGQSMIATSAPPSRIRITDDYLKAGMARAVPGAYWSKDDRAWLVDSPTPRTAAVLLRLFPELAAESPSLPALRDELRGDVRPFDNATPFNQPLANTLAELYNFQAIDLGYMAAVLEEHGGAYIGWERGLGKTLGTCCLIAETRAWSTLVVAPNTAKRSVWAAEIARWLPNWNVFVLPNEKTKRERMLVDIERYRQNRKFPPFVLVIHYEALAIIAGKGKTKRDRTAILDGWKKYGEWDLFVADEAHRLKNTDAQMVKAAKKVPAKRKLALSGSIIENHAEEIFSPLQWLFPDTYKSKWRDWNDRFLDYVESGYGKVCVGVKPEAIDRMRTELGVFMVTRRKEDELDLPPKTEQTLLVDLGTQQRRVYDELAATCLAELDRGEYVKAADGLVLLTRLRQVATGLDLFATEVTDSAKIDTALEMILDTEDEAFVCFSWFRQSCYTLAARLEAKGVESFVVTGDTKHNDRADYIDAFQAGERRVFIGTLSTLGESVNLFRASNAIFIDRSWNPAANQQAEDRIYRIGQDKPVTITHLVARNTVDEYRVLPVLASKEALRRIILGGK